MVAYLLHRADLAKLDVVVMEDFFIPMISELLSGRPAHLEWVSEW